VFRKIFFLSSILLSNFANSSIAPPLNDFPAVRIADNTFIIYGALERPNPKNKGFMNNPVFIIGEDGVVVMDPGGTLQTGEMLLRAIKKKTNKPILAVFNTHEHGDHWLANQAIKLFYPQVKIYAHTKLLKMLQETDLGQRWVDSMLSLTNNASAGTKVVPPNVAVKNTDTIRVAGLTIKVHHFGHSHTKTDIMLEVVEKSLIILGDNVMNGRLGQMTTGSFAGNIKSLQKIIKTNAKVYVPGHGKSGDVGVLKTYLEYLQTIYKWTKKFYNEGLSDFEMKKKIIPKLAKFKSWVGFYDEVGRHISISYLEIEESEF
jgi:glyoxylase-like metal-dependent hydrolase (beta-lactamase superfamily II)